MTEGLALCKTQTTWYVERTLLSVPPTLGSTWRPCFLGSVLSCSAGPAHPGAPDALSCPAAPKGKLAWGWGRASHRAATLRSDSRLPLLALGPQVRSPRALARGHVGGGSQGQVRVLQAVGL